MAKYPICAYKDGPVYAFGEDHPPIKDSDGTWHWDCWHKTRHAIKSPEMRKRISRPYRQKSKRDLYNERRAAKYANWTQKRS